MIINADMVEDALRSMKNETARGSEGIPAKLIKCGPTKLKKCWPPCLHHISMGKKYRCDGKRISALNTLSKPYGKFLKDLIEKEYGPYDLEKQAGFRASRSCINNIFSITQIIKEKSATHNNKTHLLLVNLTQAYDTVPVKKLWEVLERSLKALPLHHIYDIKNIDNKVQYFNDSLLNLINIDFPLKQSTFSKNPQPWITPNIKSMMKLRNNALKRYKRTRDLTRFQYYKTLRNFTTASIDREKKVFLEFSLHGKDAKLLCRNLKQFDIVTNNKSKDIPPVLRDVNKINNNFVNSLPAFHLTDNDVLQFYDNNLMRNFENRLRLSSVGEEDVSKGRPASRT
ncbi:hypothetical protein ILUMI_26458 [Ignelater luminosus]|uniref:Reverse transcriptase domain-containing protein n=1 Tax=Ignelater luminosus TaxID=2038154 RepID=A0A8K0C7Y1_IGNLU|nr:hypothetical protein ILUMI_26458 [Ignelater luminosus]